MFNKYLFPIQILFQKMSHLLFLRELEVQHALRRSILEDTLAEHAARSRLQTAIDKQIIAQEAAIAAENALRRSRIQAEIEASRSATEAALHRSRVAAEIQATKEKAEESIRRSRIQAQIECERVEREAVLRRSRVETGIRRDLVTNIIEKSRLESELQQVRLHQQRSIAEGLRRSRIEVETQKLSRKY